MCACVCVCVLFCFSREGGREGGVTDVLMFTTTVGMLDGVHGMNRWKGGREGGRERERERRRLGTYLGPLVTLDAVLVVGAAGLKQGLVRTSTAGDDADHLLQTRREGGRKGGRRSGE